MLAARAGGPAACGMAEFPILRQATDADLPALERLIETSTRTLLARHYSAAQLEAALGPVFGVDRQLVRDETYFACDHDGEIVACGGWSKRASVYGGDRARRYQDPLLDPARDAARIRAFFVTPAWERRGLGRALLAASEAAIREAGFTRIELAATLAGEPLYRANGYSVAARTEAPLPGGLTLTVIRMTKTVG